MNIRHLTTISFLATALTLSAADPATKWPSEIKVGEAIMEETPESAHWKFDSGFGDGSGKLIKTSEGLQVTGGETNPSLACKENFGAPLAIQFGILNLFENHSFRITLSTTYRLEFSKEFSKVILSKEAPGEPSEPIVEQNWKQFQAAIQPSEPCIVTMATDGSTLRIWVGNIQFYEGTLPENLTDVSVEISSGWNSDWTLTSFAAAELKR